MKQLLDIPAHPVDIAAYLLASLIPGHDGHVQVEDDDLVGVGPRLFHRHEAVLRLV